MSLLALYNSSRSRGCICRGAHGGHVTSEGVNRRLRKKEKTIVVTQNQATKPDREPRELPACATKYLTCSGTTVIKSFEHVRERRQGTDAPTLWTDPTNPNPTPLRAHTPAAPSNYADCTSPNN